MESRHGTTKRLVTFLAILAGLSAIFAVPLIASGTIQGKSSAFALALMWSPALAALATARLYHDDWRSFGWRPGWVRYLAIAYLLPVAYSAVAYGLAWLAGAGSFTGNWPAYLPIFLVVGTLSGALSALGEEIGWRGYLVPQLASTQTFAATALVSGLIWAAWHYPILLFTDYGTGSPRWYSLACFTVAVVGLSFAFTWLRLRSGSIWPPVLLHAGHNLFLLHVFTPLMAEHRTTYPLTGEGGLLFALAAVLVGVAFWALGPRLSTPVPGRPDRAAGKRTEGVADPTAATRGHMGLG
jgi:membrane protease YdiL (CAAX protease family)